MTTPTTELQPIDMVLHCPACGLQHIDQPETDAEYTERLHESSWWELGGDKPERWTNPHHKSHECRKIHGGCGHIWRPADVPTNGVAAVKTKGKADSPVVHPSPAPVGAQEREAFEAWLDGPSDGVRGHVATRRMTMSAQQQDAARDGWQAARSAAQGAALKTLPEQPDMGEGWSVTVCRRGVAELTISDEHYSGGRDLDEALIVGAAQHLLSFVGYGLPPCSFDPDEAAQGAVQVPLTTLAAWKDEVNTLAVLSLKAERKECAIRLKQAMADLMAAAPAHAGERSEGGA